MSAVRNAAIIAVSISVFGIAGLHFHQAKRPLEFQGSFPEPRQTSISGEVTLAAPPGYSIIATDEYEVMALVLSRERYRSGREAELSPVDFALAWGAAAEEPILSDVTFSQSGRWYYFRWENPAINVNMIAHNSANTHIITAPGDKKTLDLVLSVKRGEAVHLKGYLVRVQAEDGWRWVSSRTRTDSGNGSCEILYVTEVSFLH